jgi:membrane-associated protease RseP (regulator of RpoE activity)
VLTAIGVVVFVLLLQFSVALHEFGHLLTAKAFGMKATEYFIGFGPRIWSFRRGETEYGLKAIPAGGYVKIVGMLDAEDLPEEDRARAFHRYSAPRRLLVLAAGSISHMILAFLLLLVVFVGVGTSHATTTIGTVTPCVSTTSSGCTGGDPPSPALAAGLRPGDQVLAVGGTPVTRWQQATAAIRAAGPGPLPIRIRRDGQDLTLTPVLVAAQRPDPDHPDRTVKVGVLGVEATSRIVHAGPIAGIRDSADWMVRIVKASVVSLAHIPQKVPNLIDSLHGGQRDRTGLVGVVGAARISGQTLSYRSAPLAERAGDLLLIVAGLNVFIGLFNAVPLLPLDGGHMAVVGYETIRRRTYRLLGRAEPGKVDITKLIPLTYAFLAVLLSLTVLLIAADIVNPVNIG